MALNYGLHFAARKTKVYKKRQSTVVSDYKKLYRFEERNVTWITEYFLGTHWEKKGGGVSPQQKLQIFLRYVADPGFQNGVGEEFGVDQSTVSRIVQEVSTKIVEKMSDWIKFPSTLEEITRDKLSWANRFNIPCVIGAVDCTHIRIKKPRVDPDEYINRKGYHSINVQATCNANEQFTSILAEWPGSVHDARIFKNSPIPAVLNQFSNTVLLGDSGYGISLNVVTPYPNPSTDIQKNFNKLYAKERVIIERCFGQLKQRFCMLQYKLRTKLESYPTIILACSVLHNVAIFLNDDAHFPETPTPDPNFETICDEYEEPGSAEEIRTQGQQLRDRIASSIFTV